MKKKYLALLYKIMNISLAMWIRILNWLFPLSLMPLLALKESMHASFTRRKMQLLIRQAISIIAMS